MLFRIMFPSHCCVKTQIEVYQERICKIIREKEKNLYIWLCVKHTDIWYICMAVKDPRIMYLQEDCSVSFNTTIIL